MAAVIPDEVLEKLTCHVCKKYLSVQPVKVYFNGQIKCGRCSQVDDDGAISMYEMVAALKLFRCINRYDGCNKLLRYADVGVHEQTCISNNYKCPLCPTSGEFITFLLLDHIKTQHKNACLGKPEFVIELFSSKSEYVFFYKQYDYLFFIYVKVSSSDDRVSLHVAFVGSEIVANDVQYKALVYTQEGETRDLFRISKKERCVSLGVQSNEGFVIKYSDVSYLQQLVYILEVDTSAVSKFSSLPNFVDIYLENCRILKVSRSVQTDLNVFDYSAIDLRKVYHTVDVLETLLFPRPVLDNSPNYFISDCERFLMKKGMSKNNRVLNLFCSVCLEILDAQHAVTLQFWHVLSPIFTCSSCSLFVKENYVPIPKNLPSVKFDCKWGCGHIQKINHNCKNHPLRTQRICPMMCDEVFATLDKLKTHLNIVHRVIFSEESYFVSKDFHKSATYVMLILDRFIRLDVTVIGISIKCSVSVIDKQYSRTRYQLNVIGLVKPIYAASKFSLEENQKFKITLTSSPSFLR